MLRTRPEGEAIAILKRMKRLDCTSSALSSVIDAEVLLPGEPLRLEAVPVVLPSFSELTEFELPSRHLFEHPVLPPVRPPAINSTSHP